MKKLFLLAVVIMELNLFCGFAERKNVNWFSLLNVNKDIHVTEKWPYKNSIGKQMQIDAREFLKSLENGRVVSFIPNQTKLYESNDGKISISMEITGLTNTLENENKKASDLPQGFVYNLLTLYMTCSLTRWEQNGWIKGWSNNSRNGITMPWFEYNFDEEIEW
ncbi:MAG: hypothetical protein K6A42_06160 [Treponema sp.]|nr:hypothetical protein [Treponema sp.]